MGHAESRCYEIIGYPANCGTRDRSGGGHSARRGRSGRITGRGRGARCNTRHEVVHVAAVQAHETAPDPTEVSIPGLT